MSPFILSLILRQFFFPKIPFKTLLYHLFSSSLLLQTKREFVLFVLLILYPRKELVIEKGG